MSVWARDRCAPGSSMWPIWRSSSESGCCCTQAGSWSAKKNVRVRERNPRVNEIFARFLMAAAKVLIVLTSHEQLGGTGRKTGFWLEELAVPYNVFKAAGAEITLASPKGGAAPLDPRSEDPSPDAKAFLADPVAVAKLKATHKVSE